MTTNTVTGIVVGQYGTAIVLEIVDDDGNIINLSSYTGVTIRAISPDARTTLNFTGSFVSAPNGQISFTPTSGNTFDRDGTWIGQAQFTAASVLTLTVIFNIEVGKKI